MSALRERPRAAVATLGTLIVLAALAMLAGRVLAGADPAPAREHEQLTRARHAAAAASQQLAGARAALRTQDAKLHATATAGARWRTRTLRSERRLRMALSKATQAARGSRRKRGRR